MDVPPSRFLTAFPTPWNSFLGYYIADDRKQIAAQCGNKSKIQGVVWGKDPKHYDQYQDFLKAIANHVTLVSTVSSRATLPRHPNITWKGHLTQTQWFELLACSKFLLGLGNPLLGPSAIDSVSLGTKFINPSYKEPMLEARYSSQHPYIAKSLPSHVCSYRSGDVQDALRCINEAISETLPPVIPEDFTEMKYLERVKKIFEL